jgi:hypothetical protein
MFLNIQNVKGQTNDLQASIYNIGFGAIIGGIGAVINKKKNQKTKKVFFKGLREGALGGYLIFESKRLIREFGRQENYAYAWSSKLLNSAGNSIIENAAENNSFGDKWSFTFGFSRLEFSNKEKFKMHYKIMPISLYSTFYFSLRGDFDYKESLKTGHFIFKTYNIKYTEPNIENISGLTFTNNILLKKNSISSKYEILSHEIIHSYQYENSSAFNTYFNKKKNTTNKNIKFLKKYNTYFYTDFNYIISSSIYQLQYNNSKYESRLFEKEAFYFEK